MAGSLSRPLIDDYPTYQRELKAMRAEAGMSQAQLAAKLGIVQNTVSRVEHGDRRLDLLEWVRWMEALGVSPEQALARIRKAIRKHRRSHRSPKD